MGVADAMQTAYAWSGYMDMQRQAAFGSGAAHGYDHIIHDFVVVQQWWFLPHHSVLYKTRMCMTVQGLSNPFLAARYHSLVIAKDSVPDVLEVTAWTEDGTIMAVQHKQHSHIQVSCMACNMYFSTVASCDSNMQILPLLTIDMFAGRPISS